MTSHSDPLPTLDYQPRVPPTNRATIRFVVWIVLVAIVLGGGMAWLAMLFHSGYSRGGYTLFAGWIALGGAILGVAGLLATTPFDAIKIDRRASCALIMGGTVILQAGAMLMVSPELSEDAFRYRFDARLAAAGYSPYTAHDPVVLASASTRHESSIDRLTPHLGTATIYPPVAQSIFRAANYLGPKLRPHGSTWYPIDTLVSWSGGIPRRHAVSFSPALRLMAAVATVVTTGLLLFGLQQLGKSPWYAVLFAWNPLTLVEAAGHSHVDIFGAMFLVAAVVCCQQRRWSLAMLALALATGIKPHTVLIAPLIAIAGWREARARLPIAWFCVATIVIFAPLLNRDNFVGWYETLQLYAASWEANGSFFELVTAPFRHGDGRNLEAAKTAARLVGALGLFGTVYAVIRVKLPLVDAAYWIILIPLLLAPVVYPWYLLWGLAIVPLLHRGGGWPLLVWAATAGLSYQLLREPVWRLPAAWTLAEYLPVYGALVIEGVMAFRRRNLERVHSNSSAVRRMFGLREW